MATIKSTLALEDRMSSTLNNIDRAALANIQSFMQMDAEAKALKKTMDDFYNQNRKAIESGKMNTDMIDSVRLAYDKMQEKLYNVKNGTDTFNKATTDIISREELFERKLAVVQERMAQRKKAYQDGITSNKNFAMSFVELNQGLELLKKGLGFFQGIARMSDTYVQTTARLGLMNDGLMTTQQLQDEIFASANRVGVKYQSMADVVSKLGMQARDSFANNKEIVGFAENLNKIFTTSGLDQTAIQSTMYNLTQSLGSGQLLGQDYSILKQNAPQMIKYIQDYYGVTRKELNKMVSDGKVSGQGIKNAIFKATDDINKKFKEMPTTWGQVMSTLSNMTFKLSQPVLKIINDIANTVQNNWDKLKPVIMAVGWVVGGVAAAFVAYKVIMGISTIVTGFWTAATTLATGAQWSLNASMWAFPGTWIIIIIAAIIGAIYWFVGAYNEATNSTISATGAIVGHILVAAAVIWNTFVGLINAIIELVRWCVEPFIGVVEWILNVCQGGFDDFGAAVANLIGTIIGWFFDLGKVVTQIIDAIFGTNLTAGLTNINNSIKSWGKNNNAITLDRGTAILKPISYENAFTTGYKFGKGIDNAFGSFKDAGKMGKNGAIPDSLIGSDGAGGKALKTTSNDKLLTDEDIQLLLDVATRDYKLNYQAITPNITLTFGDIRETADVDDILDSVADKLQEIYDGNLGVG